MMSLALAHGEIAELQEKELIEVKARLQRQLDYLKNSEGERVYLRSCFFCGLFVNIRQRGYYWECDFCFNIACPLCVPRFQRCSSRPDYYYCQSSTPQREPCFSIIRWQEHLIKCQGCRESQTDQDVLSWTN